MKVFVINLDEAEDRWINYEGLGYERWCATPYSQVSEEDSLKVVSMWNINPKTHLCKTACLLSHLSLWEHIVKNKINDVLILEDDAKQVNELHNCSFKDDGITYVGGSTYSPKMTGGYKKIELDKGIHLVNHNDYRVLQTVSYYIPNYEIAKKLIEFIKDKKRWRAVDVMLGEVNKIMNVYISYPASFVERKEPSQIQTFKNKYSTQQYEFLK
tara:strand:+ start:3228 stop:3866 length:639 start_codon:yes stop_codon:yes gene_type:complete